MSHFSCAFILDYLTCAADGCRPESVFAVVGSPAFSVEGSENLQADKDAFVNYMLRAAAYRGGVRKAANPDICKNDGLDLDGVERVRSAFLKGLKILPSREVDGAVACRAVKELIDYFNLKEGLSCAAKQAEECGYPSVAAMSARAYDEISGVLAEAEKLTAGDKISVRGFAKILKSGFVSAEVSLIQPKQDAVFVSDLSECANAGSKVLFVGGLTDGVPAASQDTAILTDGELTSLEKLKLAVSPKISQVNRRVKEVTSLNFCAFSEKLYLSYPLRSGGEECGVSEAVSYVEHLITVDGSPVLPVSAKAALTADDNFAYYCAKPAPAWRRVTFFLGGNDDINERRVAAVYKFLQDERAASAPLAKEVMPTVEKGGSRADISLLYGKSVSPTALETYFACPYKAFMQQGLRVTERREGVFRPLDSGNFIHAVLGGVAAKMDEIESEEQCARTAKSTAEKLLNKAAFTVQTEDGSGKYTAEALVAEAEKVSLAMYLQLKNSAFNVEGVEKWCRVDLGGGYSVGGRIDRVDVCGDMVRIIDYKTGTVDSSATKYYMGLK
ncbi:MAG: PD-(D/E)XK nuclease family protein, partial [Clostridia bacterium]|nr:PD-(D/E)XK nuclease family protein [Clostridia bacterium]